MPMLLKFSTLPLFTYIHYMLRAAVLTSHVNPLHDV
jgi:hypothetical protein